MHLSVDRVHTEPPGNLQTMLLPFLRPHGAHLASDHQTYRHSYIVGLATADAGLILDNSPEVLFREIHTKRRTHVDQGRGMQRFGVSLREAKSGTLSFHEP